MLLPSGWVKPLLSIPPLLLFADIIIFPLLFEGIIIPPVFIALKDDLKLKLESTKPKYHCCEKIPF